MHVTQILVSKYNTSTAQSTVNREIEMFIILNKI